MVQLQSRDRRDIRINGRRTAITIEAPIWDRFRAMAIGRGVTLTRLLSDIDRTRRLESAIRGKRRVRSLSSAVRIFVLENTLRS
jgi:predicted DNA-binding ribbon-helix-helix protein